MTGFPFQCKHVRYFGRVPPMYLGVGTGSVAAVAESSVLATSRTETSLVRGKSVPSAATPTRRTTVPSYNSFNEAETAVPSEGITNSV